MKSENRMPKDQYKEPILIKTYTEGTQVNPVCSSCPNHPMNGGSGICHCILGSMVIS